MSKTRGTGLLMVWTDIDAEVEADFNRWYDEEHISRLLQVPGFLSAGRYVAIKGGPKYLAMYELEDHNVLRSAAYLDTVKYQPSPQQAKTGTSRVGRNFLRNAYRQIFPVHTNPIEQTVAMAPFGPAAFPPARLSSAAALSASIAANLYNSPNVGVLKQASAKTSDVELLSIATKPIWTSSVACSPSACTPRSRMSLRRKMSFKKPFTSPTILPRAVAPYEQRPMT